MNQRFRRLYKLTCTCVRMVFISLGVTALVMMVLAFTRVPFDVHRMLGTRASEFKFAPEAIIMMGGSGMPSESNLIRLYYVAELAARHNVAEVILLHPADTVVVNSMRSYLIQSGIDASRIGTMLKGTNTREQAMELQKQRPGLTSGKIVIVTSPEHMYRTLRVFRKLGFEKIGGVPAFENAMFVQLGYDHSKIGGKLMVPDISNQIGLRYNFWNYLKLEISCVREFLAIIYYRLNGWI